MEATGKTKKKAAPAPRSGDDGGAGEADPTGTYVYDAQLGRVVKVSARVPGLSKASGGFGEGDSLGEAGGPEGGGCGRQECGGGTCMGGGD